MARLRKWFDGVALGSSGVAGAGAFSSGFFAPLLGARRWTFLLLVMSALPAGCARLDVLSLGWVAVVGSVCVRGE